MRNVNKGRKDVSNRFSTAFGCKWPNLAAITGSCFLAASQLGNAETVAAGTPPDEFKTRNVVIVVADGERYTETWGDPAHSNIAQMAALAKDGVVFSTFKNNGRTVTVPGHTAIATGKYEGDELDNGGQSLPSQPSVLQVWLHQTQSASDKAWVIASKAKLRVLADTSQADWKGLCMPSVDCADRDDGETFDIVLQTLRQDHPRMVLINFSGPDRKGHTGDFDAYVQAIRDVDGYAAGLWKFLQDDPFYANQTAFFFTNDHGRHSGDRFAGHGCDCEGCRHILLLAMGPDFRRGEVVTNAAEQIDVPVTVARLMGYPPPVSRGRVLTELFVQPPAGKPLGIPKPVAKPDAARKPVAAERSR